MLAISHPTSPFVLTVPPSTCRPPSTVLFNPLLANAPAFAPSSAAPRPTKHERLLSMNGSRSCEQCLVSCAGPQ